MQKAYCKYCNEEFKKNRKDKIFCSRQCKGTHSKKERKYIYPFKRLKKECCDFCGFKAVHRCQLDIDHIDGNHKNNKPENLQTLCANCHRLKTFLNKEWAYEFR